MMVTMAIYLFFYLFSKSFSLVPLYLSEVVAFYKYGHHNVYNPIWDTSENKRELANINKIVQKYSIWSSQFYA